MKADPKAEGQATVYPKVIKLGDEEYEEIPREAVAVSNALARLFVELGRPKDPFSENGRKLVKVIISAWEDLYPKDRAIWLQNRQDYREHEMDVHDQVKQKTGRTLASYPMPIYRMLKKTFPDTDFGKRDIAIKMARNWPMFQFANKI